MRNKKLIAVIVVLVILTLVLGYLNMKGMDAISRKAGTITFVYGESTMKLSFYEIIALEHHEFKATEDTSNSGPSSCKYIGVLLKDVLNKASIKDETIKASSKVIIKGLDGYVIAMPTDEVLSDNRVYLAFEKNEKSLGSMKSGGSGPFQLIAMGDSFSQRWCKYVTEVSLE